MILLVLTIETTSLYKTCPNVSLHTHCSIICVLSIPLDRRSSSDEVKKLLESESLSALENVLVIEFLCQIDLFSFQFFLQSHSINRIRKPYSIIRNRSSISISIQLFSNNWTIQIIKIFNFKSLNFFKYKKRH